MSRLVRPCVLTEGLRDHEAFQAWRQLQRGDEAPPAIEVLQRNKKAAVYRLSALAPDGSDVIAKRARRITLGVERIIYERVLPQVPVPLLRCYGYAADPDEEYAWLFLEDAGGDAYLPSHESHRRLAGQWLGELHLAASSGLGAQLPARGLRHYLQVLRDCRAGLDLLSRTALPAEDVALVGRFVSFCDEIESSWSGIERECAALPETLVHGDFAVKNVRIRNLAAGQALVAFDWQFAGVGAPATDLAQSIDRVVSPDLGAYQAVMARVNRRLALRDIERIAACGNVLRVLDQVRWALSGLRVADPKWVTKAGALLRAYEPMVTATVERLEMELGR